MKLQLMDRENGNLVGIDVGEIASIKKTRDDMMFNVNGKVYYLPNKLSDFEKALKDNNFERVDLDTFVNTNGIVSVDFESQELVMSNGNRLPVSKAKLGKIKEILEG